MNDHDTTKVTSFLSCDWGTTAFRLRWIGPGLHVVREQCSADGCKALFDRALEQKRERATVSAEFMRERLREWEQFQPSPMPLVISGMASSTVGWRELPYLEGPLKLDGSNLRFEALDWGAPPWITQTLLISGVAIHPEMMRGEETEAIGILADAGPFEGVLILPGTHSKHLRIERGQIAGIATYMTGELFELLAKHSLLKASVELTASTPGTAFEEGVRWSAKNGLPRALFRVRTRSVLDRVPAIENSAFLSGVLIGAELLELGRDPMLVGGSGELQHLYARALIALEVPRSLWKVVSVDRAVPRAHALFLHERCR